MIVIFALICRISLAYKSLTYAEITQRFKDLSKRCSFVNITTAQERYNIPYPENCENCSHMIVTIGNIQDPTVPQIYFSGCLHGDERVGPVVLTELADYLCTEYHNVPWAKRIVDTHLLIMTPMTNAQGYHNNNREESIDGQWVDPNRDFPYNQHQECLVSLTAQVVMHIYEEFLIRTGITYHGGLSSLTYPWGAFNHYKNSRSTEAPDLTTFDEISKVLLKYSEAAVDIGTMNDVVYPVNGGLEDWAYAGGWDMAAISNCSKKPFTNPDGLRQVFFLLEADTQKSPPEIRYGLKKDIIQGGGLVPQYIRMSLSLIDLTQPYILHEVQYSERGILINWEIWGCVDVVATQIYYAGINEEKLWETWKSTEIKSGGCRWGKYTKFSEELNLQEAKVVIVAKVDEWSRQSNPDPSLTPQTHMFRIRNTKDYRVQHRGYVIKGNDRVFTDIIICSIKPYWILKTNLPSGYLRIEFFQDFLNVTTNISSNLFISTEGDPKRTSDLQPILSELCNLTQSLASGIYRECVKPMNLAGRLVATNNESAIISSQPPAPLRSMMAACLSGDVEIIFERASRGVILATTTGDFGWISLEIGKLFCNITIAKGHGSKLCNINTENILGLETKFVRADKVEGECVIAIRKRREIFFEYTKIQVPLSIAIILIAVKCGIASMFVYRRCKKKKNLQEPNYEQIELTFK